MLVDHPSVINEFRGRQSDLIEKLFAGGRTVDEFMDNANLVNVIDINTMRAIENAKNSSIGQALSAPNIDTVMLKTKIGIIIQHLTVCIKTLLITHQKTMMMNQL